MVAVIACVKKVSDRVCSLCVILPLCYARSKLGEGAVTGNFINMDLSTALAVSLVWTVLFNKFRSG